MKDDGKVMYIQFVVDVDGDVDVVCRGSEKYFALMLYRLLSAEGDERRRKGNVNLIFVRVF